MKITELDLNEWALENRVCPQCLEVLNLDQHYCTECLVASITFREHDRNEMYRAWGWL